MKRFLLSAALLLACSGVALAQESEFSGGGGGGITAAPGSGTAGRIPQFASATSVVDSKMTTSGTDSGTWTLYDNTAVTGVSQIITRAGAGQAASAQQEWRNNADAVLSSVTAGGLHLIPVGAAGAPGLGFTGDATTGIYSDGAGRMWFGASGSGVALINSAGLYVSGAITLSDIVFTRTGVGDVAITDTLRAETALGVQTANGALSDVQTISESITLDTGAEFTNSTADLCPANSIILSVTWRITTTIAGIDSTTIEVGDPTTSSRFGTGTVFTSGTTGIGITHMSGASTTAATGPTQGAAAKLRITLSGGADDTPSGGVVRVTVTYLSLTPPTS